jgi:hypothetical protein
MCETWLMFPWINSVDIIQQMTEQRIDRTKNELSRAGFKAPEINVNKLVDTGRINSKIFSNFPKLRDYCFYVNWNPNLNGWTIFDESNPKIMSRSTFVLIQNKLIFNHFDLFLKALNQVRKAGYTLTLAFFPLPFPAYDE